MKTAPLGKQGERFGVSKKSAKHVAIGNRWLSSVGIPSKCQDTSRLCRDGGIVRSSKVFIDCCNLTIPQSKIKDFCQLPLHKGAFGCSRTSAFIDVSQKNRKIVPHSLFAATWFLTVSTAPLGKQGERSESWIRLIDPRLRGGLGRSGL